MKAQEKGSKGGGLDILVGDEGKGEVSIRGDSVRGKRPKEGMKVARCEE